MLKQVTLEEKLKYGIKRTCRSCGVNFYDLEKHPSECPNCGAIYELHVSARVRRKEIFESGLESLTNEIPFNIDEEILEEDTSVKIADDDDPFEVLSLDDDHE